MRSRYQRYRRGRANDKLRQLTHGTRDDPPAVKHRYHPHGCRSSTAGANCGAEDPSSNHQHVGEPLFSSRWVERVLL